PLASVLQGMAGVEEIEGNAFPGQAQVKLRFALGTDMKNALVEVIGRINRLPPLPRDADRPSVSLGGDGNTNETLSWFFVQLLPGTSGPIEAQRRFIERSEEHTSELQSLRHLVCRPLPEKKNSRVPLT